MGAVCCTPDELDFGKEVELAHFYLLRVIGKGAFGKVRIVQHRKTEREYALKYISKSQCIEQKATHNILSERKLLERIEHPLIVNMRYAFQDEEHLFLALDLMAGGSMRFLLDRYTSIKEIQRRIAHRDIKPDNILLDANGHAHLSDFNIATQFYPNKLQRFSRAGSLAYMSPEIVGKQGYTTFVDWWSLGVTMFELLFGKRPFTGKSSEQVSEAILNGKVTFPDNVSEVVSQNCMDVLQGLLTKTPLDRYGCGPNGIDRLKNHAWFQGIDWQAMIQKTAIPPFKPNTNESNFDAVHELEELLLEEVPLRPHKKIVKTSMEIPLPETEDSRQRQWMDEKFLPFDYTKTTNSKKNHKNDDDDDGDHPHHHMTTTTRSLTPFTSSTSLTPTLLTTTLSATTDDTMLSTPPSTTPLDGPATGNRLFRRMGNALDQYEQSKYKAQGYVLTPNGDEEEDDDDAFTTLSDAGKKL
ncbi:unnamed protein product [Absidia cylindrospora]